MTDDDDAEQEQPYLLSFILYFRLNAEKLNVECLGHFLDPVHILHTPGV